jgi:hypothetical protein
VCIAASIPAPQSPARAEPVASECRQRRVIYAHLLSGDRALP